MRVDRLAPGRPIPGDLDGTVLARDVVVGGERWWKGRILGGDDAAALAAAMERGELPEGGVTILRPDASDVHEDAAGLRLAAAVAGDGLVTRGPAESRVDLLAAGDGVLHVRLRPLERLNRIDPLEVFTALDGSVVRAGQLVASVKVAPHLVPEAVLAEGERIARGVRGGVVRVAPFRPLRVGVLVKESLRGSDRARFERSVRAKVETLGSVLERIDYVADAVEPVAAALGQVAGRGSGSGALDVVLTAGGRSTDPDDPFFVAVAAAGGRLIRHGVPAHPGSMLWLARVGRTAILGLPTCGAYSKATAADLLLPRLLTGEPPTAATVARLGHGGILTRDMRFRFPAYARELDAPEG